MNEDRLNALFQEIRQEKTETTVQEVSKWIAISAASVGLFGLLSKFKLSILLTKKLIIMTTIASVIGIGLTALVLNLPSQNQAKSEVYKSEVQVSAINAQSIKIKNGIVPAKAITSIETKDNSVEKTNRPIEISNLELKAPVSFENNTSVTPSLLKSTKIEKIALSSSIEIRTVGSFTKVTIGNGFDLFITQGDKDEVRLEVDEKYMDLVITDVKNGHLHVKIKSNSKVVNADKMEVHLTMKTIEAFNFSGAVNAKSMNHLSADNLKLDCSGASEIEFDLECTKLDIICSGASEIKLIGMANTFVFNGSGASEISAADFVVDTANINISGASEMDCYVTEDLEVQASGASNIKYRGNPKNVNIAASGASTVKKRN